MSLRTFWLDESQEVVQAEERRAAAREVVAAAVRDTCGTTVLTRSREGVVLHPLPTTDVLDPLNWSTFRKHTILGIVMAL
jgi:hypothetical protein